MESKSPQGTIAWIDVETTGVEVSDGHHLLQVACIVTDDKLNELGTFDEAVFYDAVDAVFLREKVADDYVRSMHDATGLWERLPSGLELPRLDEELLSFLQRFEAEPGKLIFGGNSQFLDRDFLRAYAPKSYRHLHYRNLDMTSVEEFFARTQGRARFEKKRTHDALDDIRESIASCRYHWHESVPF